MAEVPDRPMLRRVFGSEDGNLYKRHGVGGRWTVFDRRSFDKRTNQEHEDWTDIQGAIAALHGSKADRAAWRRRFEARFDVVARQFFRRQDRVRWREIEVGVRVDSLRFDDSGPETEFDSVRARATDIRRRSVLTTTLAVSWRPSEWIRVMTNASWERYGERRSSPDPGQSGFLALGTRLQVSLP
jgi:hypothetical protein